MRARLKQRREDALEHIFRPLQHFIVPEPHHAKPCAPQFLRPLEILKQPLRMLPTIKLDDQPRTQTDEIHDVTPKRHLSAESIAAQMPVADESPQDPFRVGGILA